MHFSKWKKNPSSITGYLKNQLDRKEIVDFFQKQTSKKENYKLSIYFLNFYLRRRICFRSLRDLKTRDEGRIMIVPMNT